MKKLLAVLLSALMISAVFAGCSGKDTDDTETKSKKKQESTSVSQMASEAATEAVVPTIPEETTEATSAFIDEDIDTDVDFPPFDPIPISSLKFNEADTCMKCDQVKDCAVISYNGIDYSYCEECANTCTGCDGQATEIYTYIGVPMPLCEDCEDILSDF